MFHLTAGDVAFGLFILALMATALYVAERIRKGDYNG